jgi:hypothetical protein
MTKHDKYLILVILFLAVIGFSLTYLASKPKIPLVAEISVDGKSMMKIDLNNTPEKRFEITGYVGTSIVEVKKGAIRMAYSPCKDKYCQKTGWIRQPGQIIACMPNRVVIKTAPLQNSVNSVSY